MRHSTSISPGTKRSIRLVPLTHDTLSKTWEAEAYSLSTHRREKRLGAPPSPHTRSMRGKWPRRSRWTATRTRWDEGVSACLEDA